MTDLKFELNRSLSRLEAADQLSALAAMLRRGGQAELELGSGTMSLRIPDDLRSEIEVEVDDGQIELEIELTWSIEGARTAPRKPAAAPGNVPDAAADKAPRKAAEKAPARKTAPAGKSGRGSTATSRSKSAKRSAAKAP